jgi:hypothetical protein
MSVAKGFVIPADGGKHFDHARARCARPSSWTERDGTPAWRAHAGQRHPGPAARLTRRSCTSSGGGGAAVGT